MRDNIGFVFQFFNLLPMLTAKENMLLPMAIAGREPDADWLNTVIDETGYMRDRRLRTDRPSLSGGQQQRVAIGRGPAQPADGAVRRRAHRQPGLQLLGGDPRPACAALRSDSVGQTVVMVTHDPKAAAIADRLLFLSDGQIVKDLAGADENEIVDAMKGL